MCPLHFSVHVQRSFAGNFGPSGFEPGRQGLPVLHTPKTLSEPGPTRQHRQRSLSFLLNRQNPTLTPATRVMQGRRVTTATSQTSQLCRRPIKAEAPPNLPRYSSFSRMDGAVVMCFRLPALHCGKVSLSTGLCLGSHINALKRHD